MSLFDDALKERFATSPEIAPIKVSPTDTLLIYDSATGTVMRMPVSILYSALGSAFASLIDGKVPASQLPSFVDDVLEFANFAAFPATGESGKIYIALDTNKTYRWSGSTYIYITSGAVNSVAGKTGVVILNKSDVGLSNADNTSDANKPISTAQQTALDLKANKSQSAWIAVSSFLNSWANYGTTPGGYSDASYFKDEFGIVHLRGLVKNGTVGSVAFNLPTGFRPEFIKVYSASSGGAYATLRVNPNGDVVPYTGANTYFSLDGVKFKAV